MIKRNSGHRSHRVSSRNLLTSAKRRRSYRPTFETLERREVLVAPTIVGSALSGPYLDVPATGPAFVSGAADDPTDPARTLGLVFTVADAETPAANLIVNATSSNTAVVANADLILSGNGADRTLRITPTGVGYTDITVTVTDGEALASNYVVHYAASAATANPARSHFHVGAADASASLAVDNDYMFVANDEDQVLRLYNRNQSGLPVASFDVTASLGLTQIDNDTGLLREVDIEGSTRVGNRLYWIGSLSNAANGNSNRPNRNRVFATDLSGTGANATLSFVGHYDALRQDLINWDVNNTHGLGANFFGLAASTANGVTPETADGSGFNLEGLTMAPGSSTTAYIGFRAPIVLPASRTDALVVPITNFPDLITGTAPVFGAPIQLDLNTAGEFGPRGIRSMETNGTEILIVAGPAASAPGGAINPFKLFTWDGNANNAPQALGANLNGLNPEAIVTVPASPLKGTVVQLLSDSGDTIFYNDGIAAKDLPDVNFRKTRSDLVRILPSDKIGAKRTNQFLQDVNGSGLWEGASDRINTFGNATDTPLVGDWNGDGLDEIAVHRDRTFYQDLNGNGTWDGPAGGDQQRKFGIVGDVPVVGDWDGDGQDDIGVQRGNAFYLDASGDGVWGGLAGGDLFHTFGNAGDTPLSGDWDGDGSDEIGVHRLNQFYLDLSSNGSWGSGDVVYNFGNPSDLPLTGDWDGDGSDEIGAKRGNMFYLDVNGNGVWNGGAGDSVHVFGDAGDQPIIGRWRPLGALMAAGGAALGGPAVDALTVSALEPIRQQAIVLWTNTGLSSAQQQSLAAVQFHIVDLAGAQLGLALGGTILLDADAAGYGWFVDPTPADNSEFSSPETQIPNLQSVDLLTAVLHELGHELGFDHDDDIAAMFETLAAGTRRLTQ